jgi:hypothetical protein
MSFFSLGKSKPYYNKEKEKEKKLKYCARCNSKYDANFVDCSRCFRLQCQDCGFLHYWMFEYPADANEPTRNGNCGRCGSVYNALVTVTKLVNGKLRPCPPFDSCERAMPTNP